MTTHKSKDSSSLDQNAGPENPSLEDAALEWIPQGELPENSNSAKDQNSPFSLIENPTEINLPDAFTDEDLELELQERITDSDESLDRLKDTLEDTEDKLVKAELLMREQAEAQATADLLKSQLDEEDALTREEIEISQATEEAAAPSFSDIPEQERKGALEALLFVSDKALKPENMVKLLGSEKPTP